MYSIKEAAERVGVSADTLRRWEREGLHTALRDGNVNRVYTEDDLMKLWRLKLTSKERMKAKCRESAVERTAEVRLATQRPVVRTSAALLRERVAEVLRATGTEVSDWRFLLAYYKTFHNTTNLAALAAGNAPTPETLGRRRREVMQNGFTSAE